ncbi:hypothetical protein ACJX0J_012761, partial [Zea mays]
TDLHHYMALPPFIHHLERCVNCITTSTVALEQDNISITLGFSNIFAIVHNKTFSLYLFLLCLY